MFVVLLTVALRKRVFLFLVYALSTVDNSAWCPTVCEPVIVRLFAFLVVIVYN